MGKYKAIGFDMDGTLIDNNAMRNNVAEKLKTVKQMPGTVQDLRRDIIENYFVQIAHKTTEPFVYKGKSYPYQELAAYIEYEYCNHAVWFEGAEAFLKTLKEAGFRLFILTNGEHDFQQPKIDSIHLERYMEHCFITEDIGAEKPNPAAFRYVEQYMGIHPEEYLFFGDREETDVVGALKAGADCVNMRNANDSQATYVVDGYGDLPGLMAICKKK